MSIFRGLDHRAKRTVAGRIRDRIIQINGPENESAMPDYCDYCGGHPIVVCVDKQRENKVLIRL